MKLITLTLSLLIASAVHADQVSAYSCWANCLHVNFAGHRLYSMGSIEGIAKTKQKAFAQLTRSCNRALSRAGLDGHTYLAIGDFSAFQHTSTHGRGSSTATAGVVFGRRFVSAYATSSSRWTIETEENTEVSLEIATPNSACEQVEVDETELVPFYEGDRTIFG